MIKQLTSIAGYAGSDILFRYSKEETKESIQLYLKKRNEELQCDMFDLNIEFRPRSTFIVKKNYYV